MLITEDQLDVWVRGHPQDAQGLIVELVWRLAAASCPKPQERRFPLSIGQHGADGVLEVEIPFGPFVPVSLSYWEIGTGLNARNKATSDYKELTASVPPSIRRETTFVFVTPLSGRRAWEHSWQKKAQARWIENRRKKKEWKDVRIIDGAKLIDWISQFLAVELWLAQKISGVPPWQISVPAQHWGVVRSFGEPPPLTPELFLANRTEACAKLKELFNGTIVQLRLTTHFPDQVVDFVSAFISSLDDESRADAEGRCLIISGIDGWNTICTQPQWKNHILIADSSLDLGGAAGTKLIQRARRAGQGVIFGGPQGVIPAPASVTLPPPHSHQIQELLEKAGYNTERARALAQRSGRNLSSLLRCVQNLSLLPAWAERSEAAELAIAQILGSWSETSAADRSVIEGLSGKQYGEWIGMMREVALRPATPLIQRDDNWKFVPRYEGWYALGPRLYNEHLDRLSTAVRTVLLERDPQFQLPPGERYAASIHGKVMAHSRALRNGLAETLALLGSHPKALTSCSVEKAELTAVMTVREIFTEADWILWASLNNLLPLLAEAAPGEFLDAVERALQQDPCPFDEVFSQEGNGLLGRNYMTGLLWALETLAWDTAYLSRVVICLGELAERDPGGNWANRPINSLTTIFLPWLPQTCASIDGRIAAVRTLMAELPNIAWKLLLSLLPQLLSSSSYTRKPAWRKTIPDDWRDGVTHGEYLEQVSAYAQLAIRQAEGDIGKIAELIEHVGNLPQPALEQFLDHLGSDSVTKLPERDRVYLWQELVDVVNKHRKFADAKWAMDAELVDRIAALADRLAPDSPFFRHQRLFSERDADLWEEKGNYDEQMAELEKRRQAAVEEIATVGGTEAVLAFAKAVESSWRVGIAFGFVGGKDADATVLPALLESEDKSLAQFSGGYIWGRFRSRSWEWVDGAVKPNWSSAQTGRFLSFLPFRAETWERASLLLGEDQSAYWSKTIVNPYEAETGLELAIDKLIENERPYAAIGCLYKMLRSKEPLDNKRAMWALSQALRSPESSGSMDIHETVEIIKALQNDPATNPDDLFRIEWAYLPILDQHHGALPKLLSRRLADNPTFFCEVIRLVFRSKKETPPMEELSEEKKAIASNAYRLLSEWRIPPGLGDEGVYDGNALKRWVESVKKECAETGHLEIALTMVGQVLVHVPPDPDGLWIHRSAAEVLNSKDAQDMRDGFRTKLYNSRGVYWVDPTGKPERELAAKYRTEAEAVANAGYQRLATVLQQLAATYNREAERLSSREPFDD